MLAVVRPWMNTMMNLQMTPKENTSSGVKD